MILALVYPKAQKAESDIAANLLVAFTIVSLVLAVSLLFLDLTFNRVNFAAGTFGILTLTAYSGLIGQFAYRLFRGKNVIAGLIVVTGSLAVVIVILGALVDMLKLSGPSHISIGLLLLPLLFANAVTLGLVSSHRKIG